MGCFHSFNSLLRFNRFLMECDNENIRHPFNSLLRFNELDDPRVIAYKQGQFFQFSFEIQPEDWIGKKARVHVPFNSLLRFNFRYRYISVSKENLAFNSLLRFNLRFRSWA